MKSKLSYSDIAIFSGIIALVIFAHFCVAGSPARASGHRPLLLQGGGMTYAEPVNNRLSELEFNARTTLSYLGQAQQSYASSHADWRYVWLQDLVNSGYLQPNATGRTLTASYSITFYIPPDQSGFSLIAEPLELDLRSWMITENQDVLLLTPSVMDDPDENWAEVRSMQLDNLYEYGHYEYINTLMLWSYTPVLQCRYNRELTSYLLTALTEDYMRGFIPDDSLIYISSYASYLVGDVRDIED